jgi:hypothetical protein
MFIHPKWFIRTFFLAWTTASQLSSGPKDMFLSCGNSPNILRGYIPPRERPVEFLGGSGREQKFLCQGGPEPKTMTGLHKH